MMTEYDRIHQGELCGLCGFRRWDHFSDPEVCPTGIRSVNMEDSSDENPRFKGDFRRRQFFQPAPKPDAGPGPGIPPVIRPEWITVTGTGTVKVADTPTGTGTLVHTPAYTIGPDQPNPLYAAAPFFVAPIDLTDAECERLIRHKDRLLQDKFIAMVQATAFTPAPPAVACQKENLGVIECACTGCPTCTWYRDETLDLEIEIEDEVSGRILDVKLFLERDRKSGEDEIVAAALDWHAKANRKPVLRSKAQGAVLTNPLLDSRLRGSPLGRMPNWRER